MSWVSQIIQIRNLSALNDLDQVEIDDMSRVCERVFQHPPNVSSGYVFCGANSYQVCEIR